MTQTKQQADAILKDGYRVAVGYKKNRKRQQGRPTFTGGPAQGSVIPGGSKGPWKPGGQHIAQGAGVRPIGRPPYQPGSMGTVSSNRPQQANTNNAGPDQKDIGRARHKRTALGKAKARAKGVREAGGQIGTDHAARLAKLREQLGAAGRRKNDQGDGGPGQGFTDKEWRGQRKPQTEGKDHGPSAGAQKQGDGFQSKLKEAKQAVRESRKGVRGAAGVVSVGQGNVATNKKLYDEQTMADRQKLIGTYSKHYAKLRKLRNRKSFG
jgi:hypothetical protein